MRSPARTARTSGPTNATSPQTQRFGAGAAVAGMSSPARVLRSPSSGFSTTIRSPVSRTSSLGVRFPRAFGLCLGAALTSPLSHATTCGPVRESRRPRRGDSQTASRGARPDCLVGCTPVNAGDLVDDAVKTLRASPAIDHWLRDRELIEAEDLLGHAIGTEDFDRDTEVSPGERRRFERMIERRAKGEPVQLIKGYAIFRGLEVLARPGVFVPRDSTEFLAEQAVRRVRRRRQPVLVDVATGGGGIALAVVNEVRRARVYGTDISPEAIRVARANARKLRLPATFVVGDLYGGLPKHLRGGVDVVTLHPPYVARSELRELPEEIRRWEPAHTLTARSSDGLGIVERSTTEAPAWLRPGGWMLIEVSPDRARAVRSVMQRTGFRDVRSTMDRGFKVTRVLVGRSP